TRRSSGMRGSSSRASGRPWPGRWSSSPRETASAIFCSARKSSISMASRAYRSAPTDATTFYPRLIGRHGAVAGNSYLSVNAGVDVLKAGGTALERYGTMPLREAIAPAIELARDGFPASQGLVNQEKYGLRYLSDQFERWPASKILYMPVPEVGALVKNEALARTYDYLANAK